MSRYFVIVVAVLALVALVNCTDWDTKCPTCIKETGALRPMLYKQDMIVKAAVDKCLYYSDPPLPECMDEVAMLQRTLSYIKSANDYDYCRATSYCPGDKKFMGQKFMPIDEISEFVNDMQ